MAEYNGVHNNFYDFPVTDPFSAVYKKIKDAQKDMTVGYPKCSINRRPFGTLIEIIFTYRISPGKSCDNRGKSRLNFSLYLHIACMFSLEFYIISPCLIFFIIKLHLEELNISGEKQIISTHLAFRNGLWLNSPKLGD